MSSAIRKVPPSKSLETFHGILQSNDDVNMATATMRIIRNFSLAASVAAQVFAMKLTWNNMVAIQK